MLPMVARVYCALKARHVAAGKPEQGWVFPSGSREGHFNKDTAKDQHAKAIASANAEAERNGLQKLIHFQPYILRHTALTELAKAGCDAFTLARIAGHSSIIITQRYVHPQADAIERAFAPFVQHVPKQLEAPKAKPDETQVGTNLGTAESGPVAVPA
jgi:integrase